MLLQVIVFTLVDFSSSYTSRQGCYGSTFTFSPPQGATSIYYMPRTGDEKILVVQDRKSKHERFEPSFLSIKMKDLTEQDDGAVLHFDPVKHESIVLTITDCRTPTTRNYGRAFSWKVPSNAKYLEFARVVYEGSSDKPIVIWNRTDPSSGRGIINHGYFEIYELKQKDSGYYKFRGSENKLVQWKRLKVEENYINSERIEGDDLDMDFPIKFQLLEIKFIADDTGAEQIIEKSSMRHRMEVTDSYFTLRDLKDKDSGTYRFIDADGNVALRVQLEVRKKELSTWAYFAIPAVIIFGILFGICCCCVKKCCCKKSSSKRNDPGSTEAGGVPVYYHDSNQPTPPTVTLLSVEPRRFTADADATIYNAAGSSMDSPPPYQTTVTRDLGPTSFNSTSSDFEPKFELKGSIFSAPPLSSDISIQDVYTSDKLNFL